MFQVSKFSWNFKFHHCTSSPAQPQPVGALLEEQQELFREFSNRAQQPLQKGQDVEKHLKSLPFPNPPQVTDMPITSGIS